MRRVSAAGIQMLLASRCTDLEGEVLEQGVLEGCGELRCLRLHRLEGVAREDLHGGVRRGGS